MRYYLHPKVYSQGKKILKEDPSTYDKYEYPYLLKPGTSQNDPKLAKTSQTSRSDPKPAKTTQEKLRNDQKLLKILKFGKFAILH